MELHISINEIRQKFNLPENVKIVISETIPFQKDIIKIFNELSDSKKNSVKKILPWSNQDFDTLMQLMNARDIESIESFCISKGIQPDNLWNTIKTFEDLPEFFQKWMDLCLANKITKLQHAYPKVETHILMEISQEILDVMKQPYSQKIKTKQINSVFHDRYLPSKQFWNILKSL